MSRIESAFRKATGRAALIPFLNAGDPTFDESVALFQTVLSSGADLVEIGIPYSDPLADGPVIQASALRSLQAGFRLPRAFELASKLRENTDKGLIFFTYINPLIQYTPESFFKDAALAGVDGVIVPDLPYEESGEVSTIAKKYGVDFIPLIAPTSNEERIARISDGASGFVYCVSSLGVTGERAKMSNRVQELVETAKRYTSVPVAVGFGVSGPDQANAIASYADGVIVGSAFIRQVEKAMEINGPSDGIVEGVRTFAQELSAAIQ